MLPRNNSIHSFKYILTLNCYLDLPQLTTLSIGNSAFEKTSTLIIESRWSKVGLWIDLPSFNSFSLLRNAFKFTEDVYLKNTPFTDGHITIQKKDTSFTKVTSTSIVSDKGKIKKGEWFVVSTRLKKCILQGMCY